MKHVTLPESIWMFPKIMVPPKFKSSILKRVFHYKPSIWGTPIFGNTHITVCTVKWMFGRRFVSLKRWLPSALFFFLAPLNRGTFEPRDEQVIACRFLDFYPFKKNGCNLTCCALLFFNAWCVFWDAALPPSQWFNF